jgi:hypothetical protein
LQAQIRNVEGEMRAACDAVRECKTRIYDHANESDAATP